MIGQRGTEKSPGQSGTSNLIGQTNSPVPRVGREGLSQMDAAGEELEVTPWWEENVNGLMPAVKRGRVVEREDWDPPMPLGDHGKLQGRKEKLVKMVVEGRATLNDVFGLDGEAAAHCWATLKTAAFLRAQHLARRYNREVRVDIYVGPPGTGKTYRAINHVEADQVGDVYVKSVGATGFWEGYTGQSRVVIDDMQGASQGWVMPSLLQILQSYQTIVEVKGSSQVLAATHITITSNSKPWDWFPGDAQYAALCRRIDYIYDFQSKRRIVLHERGSRGWFNFLGLPLDTYE